MAQTSATIDQTGAVVLTIDGEETHLSATTPAAARAMLIDRLARRASETGPIHVDVDDAETGLSRLQINADRTVDVLPSGAEAIIDEAPRRAPRAAASKPQPRASTARAKEESPPPAPAPPKTIHGRAAEAFTETQRPAADWPAQAGWRGSLNRASGGTLKLRPGRQEARLREARRAIQRGLAGHKTVAFVNIKGGVGKSTNCYLAGATYGRERGGSLLDWDSNPDKGTLGDRAMTSGHDHTAIDLLNQIGYFTDHQRGEEDLVNFVRPQGANHFDVLASQNTASTAVPIDGEGFMKLHAALRRFYRLILVDTGNASNTDTWQAAIRAADVLVVCTLNKEDSAKTAAATLDTLYSQGYGDKVENAVVIITETQAPNRTSDDRLARMQATFGALVRDVVKVPFDPHLDEGGRIEWNSLKPQTREAFLFVNAAITNGL